MNMASFSTIIEALAPPVKLSADAIVTEEDLPSKHKNGHMKKGRAISDPAPAF
jgi:hypothetical protein